MQPSERPPHTARLLRRVKTIEAPLVQVWGWPGSGRAALLEALLEAEGERAAALSLGELANDRSSKEALDYAQHGGARWLVAGACPPERLAQLVRWLKPGRRLVFITAVRQAMDPLPGGIVGPEELLLERREVASLWRRTLGTEPPNPESVRRLHDASDGWYRPLSLALDAEGPAAVSSDPAELLEISAVRSFLRHEVVGSLPEEERETLLREPLPGGDEPSSGRSAASLGPSRLERLLDERGLWVEEGRDRRLPRLLAAYLDRERGRSGAVVRPAAQPTAAAAPVVGYALRLLGEPAVRPLVGETEGRLLQWRLKRSFKILAFLASSPGLQADRGELIEAVWPTEDEEKIQKNFHPTLSHLRRALYGDHREGPAPLVFRDGIYRLSPEIGWTIDLAEFTRLLEEGRRLLPGEPERAAAVWREAWGVYRGPFLQGHYDTWVAARREVYQRSYLDLLRELGDLYVRLERYAEAMDAYRAVLVEDPLQERVHVAVMRLYSREGRRDLVRRQYDRLSTLLLEELGVPPLGETTREFHLLMG